MATTIEVERDGTFEAIDYRSFQIEIVTSAIAPTPSATVVTTAREDLSANQALRITIDGTTAFEGVTNSPGTVQSTGSVELSVDHPGAALFSEQVDLSLSSPTSEAVLSAALTNAERGGDFTLDYAGTAVSLASDYEVTNRPVAQVFRDIMDRTSRVWWLEPGGTTIHVEPVGDRGTWQALDAQNDGVSVRSYEAGSVSTVRNDVTVTATADEAVSATATDSTSISEYGRRSESINIGYAATQAEAQDYADELLIPDPLAQADLRVPQSVGDVVQPLANYQLDLTDASKGIDETNLVVEKQVLEQGRVRLRVGEGSGVSLQNVNRNSKSNDDETEPGTVYGNDRLGTDSVDSDQLVDTSVIESKLADLAVSTTKLQNNAVINGKLSDLSVSETKIQDDSISTPKLVAEAVTASEIEADTITAAQIAAGTITALEIQSGTITAGEIEAGTITALEIAAGTLTANEIQTGTLTADQIDTLDLDTEQLSVTSGGEGIEFGIDDTVTMRPIGDELAQLGESGNRFDAVWTRGVQADQLIGEGNSFIDTLVVGPGDFRSETVLPSGGLNTGNVGLTGDWWEAMRAGAYFEETPFDVETTRAGIDLEELCRCSWSDPPAYVVEGSRAKQGSAEGGLSSGAGDGSERGLELGHMANYLLETCKAQQEHIADLTTRLDDLEARLDALEDPNA